MFDARPMHDPRIRTSDNKGCVPAEVGQLELRPATQEKLRTQVVAAEMLSKVRWQVAPSQDALLRKLSQALQDRKTTSSLPLLLRDTSSTVNASPSRLTRSSGFRFCRLLPHCLGANTLRNLHNMHHDITKRLRARNAAATVTHSGEAVLLLRVFRDRFRDNFTSNLPSGLGVVAQARYRAPASFGSACETNGVGLGVQRVGCLVSHDADHLDKSETMMNRVAGLESDYAGVAPIPAFTSFCRHLHLHLRSRCSPWGTLQDLSSGTCV